MTETELKCKTTRRHKNKPTLQTETRQTENTSIMSSKSTLTINLPIRSMSADYVGKQKDEKIDFLQMTTTKHKEESSATDRRGSRISSHQ